MQAFLETPRFPDNISYGSSGGPGFKTGISEGHSGLEQRTVEWSIARARYNVAKGITDKTDMDEVRAFFYSVRGRASGFRFKDWGDYALFTENIGTGDGSTLIFPIIKTYAVGSLDYVRRIYKPLATGSDSLSFRVYVDATLKTLTTHYTLNTETGVITFTGGNAPAATKDVTVTGEFDVPVRFDTDQMDAAHDGFLTETWASIPLVELIEEPT
jgi:uncharacterized protein (TIGR02217 family)